MELYDPTIKKANFLAPSLKYFLYFRRELIFQEMKLSSP